MTAKDFVRPETDNSLSAAPAWDAYSVWLTRVSSRKTAAETTPEASAGWDPFEIWHSRIKKTPKTP